MTRLNLSANKNPAIMVAQLRRYNFVLDDDVTLKDYTPISPGDGTMTFTPTSTVARYAAIGNLGFLSIWCVGTTSVGASPNITLSLPDMGFYPVNRVKQQPAPATVLDGGTYIAGLAFISSSRITFTRYDGANFGLGAGREVAMNAWVEIVRDPNHI